MGYDVTISICKKPPRFLYRAIHSEYAGGGLQARGMNVVKPDALDFQIHLENHIDWQNPSLSPFMSTTSDDGKAVGLCKMFKEQGRSGIRLLKIDTQSLGWEEKQQRLWNLKEIMTRFRLGWKQYHTGEYLIEQFIPWESVTYVDWTVTSEMK
jgi:hypothetical protein